MADETIRDNFVVGQQSIKIQGEKSLDGVRIVRLMLPGDNMRGYHARGLVLKEAKLLIARLENTVKWLETGDENRMF